MCVCVFFKRFRSCRLLILTAPMISWRQATSNVHRLRLIAPSLCHEAITCFHFSARLDEAVAFTSVWTIGLYPDQTRAWAGGNAFFWNKLDDCTRKPTDWCGSAKRNDTQSGATVVYNARNHLFRKQRLCACVRARRTHKRHLNATTIRTKPYA